jgi:hypothetical protein
MEMNSLAAPKGPERAESAEDLRGQLLAHLERGQNKDGGWGFHAGDESRVEPTCWAAGVLVHADHVRQTSVTHAVDFLNTKQLPDGSWPAIGGMTSGSWVTSLACIFLSRCGEDRRAVDAGLKWLCDDYPRDSSFWQKFLGRFASKKDLVTQNDEYRGWGWTPRTSSWVEPTALALIAFARANPPQLASQIEQRRALAVGLLYDRMCAGGGWNCGNPRVYGVDGQALILPTCWALLALRDATEHPNRRVSLEWLERQISGIRSAGSLAAAILTLESYGIHPPPQPTLSDYSADELMAQGTHVASWVAMALGTGGTLLSAGPRTTGGESQ